MFSQPMVLFFYIRLSRIKKQLDLVDEYHFIFTSPK